LKELLLLDDSTILKGSTPLSPKNSKNFPSVLNEGYEAYIVWEADERGQTKPT